MHRKKAGSIEERNQQNSTKNKTYLRKGKSQTKSNLSVIKFETQSQEQAKASQEQPTAKASQGQQQAQIASHGQQRAQIAPQELQQSTYRTPRTAASTKPMESQEQVNASQGKQ